MLRKTRASLAIVCFLLFTLLFVDFTGILQVWFGWLAKIQFLPAVLALNVGVIILLITLTFVFGRIYCSVICPLGIFQDIVARAGRRKKKLPYTYSKQKNGLRYGIFAIFIVALILGVNVLVAFLDPYGIYGRISHCFFQPLWMEGNNLLALAAQHMDSYAFYHVDVWIKSLPVFIVTAVMMFFIMSLAWKNGRTYCNTICPVGTILGFMSRYSLFRICIDKEKCNHCMVCSHNCKAACINGAQSEVDNSRCVVCMDCIDKCKKKAISYRFAYARNKKSVTDVQSVQQTKDEERRNFLTGLLFLLTASIKAQVTDKTEKIKMDGGLTDIINKKAPHRQTSITPSGSQSARNLQTHCTACQLCVSVCPNDVLCPSTSLDSFMQPTMSYERGYCRPECIICSEVCPTKAILKISQEQKSSIQIGHAVWVKENCIPVTEEQACDNCARHCPVNAISMIPSEAGNSDSLQIPAVNTERCIGCGACENLCPARPFSAIYVEGHQRHRII